MILGLVRWMQPVHGYDVKRELESWQADEWTTIATGSIYHALRKMAVPFGVSQLAQDAAIASLAAEAELFERVELITKERGRVIDALRDQGWTVPTSEGNFVWLRLGERTMEFAERAQAAGVVVRPFAGEGARVSIGEVDGNDLFLGVAAAFRS